MTGDKSAIFRSASTTYYYASWFFPKPIRDQIFTLYAFVRIADDLVDQTPPNIKAFNQLRKDVKNGFLGQTISDPIVNDMIDLCKKASIDPDWVNSFLDSMQADLHKKIYNTLEELEKYIYGSAEVIGLMMAKIMGLSPKSYPSAQAQGKAMQLINMIRDVKEDYQLGRKYLPHLPELPIDEKHIQQFTTAMHEYIHLYFNWQQQAKPGWKHMPLRYRVAVRTADSMYTWTAKTLQSNPSLVFTHKIKPSKGFVLQTGFLIWIQELLGL